MIQYLRFTAADETKWAAFGHCKVLKVWGMNNQASDRFIQFHTKPVLLLTAGDVPAVAALYARANEWFEWNFNEADSLTLSELTIAVSSTGPTYTAITNTGLDMTVMIDTEMPVVDNITTCATETDVNSAQIWTAASGPKTLYRLDVTSVQATAAYVELGTDSGSEPSLMLPTTVANETVTYHFGVHGIMRQGLTVRLYNLTGGAFVAVSSGDFVITSFYA